MSVERDSDEEARVLDHLDEREVAGPIVFSHGFLLHDAPPDWEFDAVDAEKFERLETC